MCVKLLNPNAQEWSPTPLQPPYLPHHFFPPHSAAPPPPPQALQVVYLAFPAALRRTPRYIPPRFRSALPPRLRKPVPVKKKKIHPPPLPPLQVWKPKNHGGASLSPAPISPSPALYSTVMIKNIPNQLRRDCMLKFLDDLCKFHSLEYDFLYLPMDFRRKHNLGYAFLNLTCAAAAGEFKKILQNYKWGVVHSKEGPINSPKICEITWARIQGKAALLRRFKNANFTCDELDFLPVVLDPPRNGSDPNPPPPVVIGRLCDRNRSETH